MMRLKLTTLSDREIARRLAVDHATVINWRKKLSGENSPDTPASRTVTVQRGGTT